MSHFPSIHWFLFLYSLVSQLTNHSFCSVTKFYCYIIRTDFCVGTNLALFSGYLSTKNKKRKEKRPKIVKHIYINTQLPFHLANMFWRLMSCCRPSLAIELYTLFLKTSLHFSFCFQEFSNSKLHRSLSV